jgi:hypothetical protein
MSELEEVKQDIKDAKAALKRAEDSNDRELILERERRLNLLLKKEDRLTTGKFHSHCLIDQNQLIRNLFFRLNFTLNYLNFRGS